MGRLRLLLIFVLFDVCLGLGVVVLQQACASPMLESGPAYEGPPDLTPERPWGDPRFNELPGYTRRTPAEWAALTKDKDDDVRLGAAFALGDRDPPGEGRRSSVDRAAQGQRGRGSVGGCSRATR